MKVLRDKALAHQRPPGFDPQATVLDLVSEVVDLKEVEIFDDDDGKYDPA